MRPDALGSNWDGCPPKSALDQRELNLRSDTNQIDAMQEIGLPASQNECCSREGIHAVFSGTSPDINR